MNRRNFILGLGTAATLSGAASVTGASISNSINSTANFNVVAENQLVVRKNNALDDTTMNTSSQYSGFLNHDENSTSDFAPTAADDQDSFPNMTIDNGTNDQLDMALAIENANTSANRNATAGFPSSTPYNESAGDNSNGSGGIAPLEIENPVSSSERVAVEFVPGSTVENASDEQAARELLSDLFSFGINGTRISPEPGDVTGTSGNITTDNSNNGEVVNANTATQVNFTINMNAAKADRLADLAGGGSASFTGDQEALDLLDTAVFGTTA